MKSRHGLTGQEGFSLIEVLVVALILGIAITGMTVLLSRGQMEVVAQGDTRIALYLAQQKIERLRGLGLDAAKLENLDGIHGKLNYADANANSWCGDPLVPNSQNNEPCYDETLSAGFGQQGPTLTQVDGQTFRRLTCVRYVQDDNPELPADVPLTEPPSNWTCPSCDTTQASCTRVTKRVRVAVIPRVLGSDDAADVSRAIDPNRVTLDVVLTKVAKP